MKNPRLEARVAALGLAAAALAGCSSSGGHAERDAACRPECQSQGQSDYQMPHGSWGAGRSWALVFSPGSQEMASVDPTQAPEYGRNNDALGYRQDGPVLASNEWPQPDRPDLFYSRTIQLQTRPDQVQFFDYGSRYYYGGGWSSSSGSYPSSGTWGFWR